MSLKIPPIDTRLEIIMTEPYLKEDLIIIGKLIKCYRDGYVTGDGKWDHLNRDPSIYKICHMLLINIEEDKKTRLKAIRLDQIKSIKILGKKKEVGREKAK